jgi:proliferating cell nuclear antigen PCNA
MSSSLSSTSYTFFCKTSEGYIVKTLAELLQNNIKNGCFLLSRKGIILRMTDSNKKILIDIDMQADNFTQYKYKSNNTMSIGLNFSHFYKMVKNIKKKDSVVLFIEEDKQNELGIRVIPKEKNRVTTSFVKIQNLQSLDIELPDGYSNSIIIPSNEYIKMIKDLNNIGGNSINISSNNNVIKFSCNSNGVYSRDIMFGENEDDDEKENISQDFETEQLSRISKVAGLSTQIQIYQSPNLPILFKSNVGNLGKIFVYLKDKTLHEDLNDNDD